LFLPSFFHIGGHWPAQTPPSFLMGRFLSLRELFLGEKSSGPAHNSIGAANFEAGTYSNLKQ
jgi:hypothetical protein